MNYNIVFVCTGNACRSPFAETVLKQMLKEANINNVDVWSCGTLDWGSNPRDAQMVLTAKELGYTMEGTTQRMRRDDMVRGLCPLVFSAMYSTAPSMMLSLRRVSKSPARQPIRH